MKKPKIDEAENICCCGHHRDDHGSACVGDGGECGCEQFNPMTYRSQEELERRSMLQAMAGKPPTQKQMSLIESYGLKQPKDRADAFRIIEDALAE